MQQTDLTLLKPEIDYTDFQKIDIRVGTIVTAEKVEGSDKLIKMQVDFGSLGQRQILTGMALWYQPQDLIGMKTTFVINLKTRKLMGLESQGMIFALGLSHDSKPVFLTPKSEVINGEGAC